MTKQKPMDVVQREIDRLQNILKEGLHPVYLGSFEEFLYDFHPDFSWNTNNVLEYQSLLDSPEWMKVAEEVREKRGYDFIKEMREAIVDLCQDPEYAEVREQLNALYMSRGKTLNEILTEQTSQENGEGTSQEI
jgi:hypothetical protein